MFSVHFHGFPWISAAARGTPRSGRGGPGVVTTPFSKWGFTLRCSKMLPLSIGPSVAFRGPREVPHTHIKYNTWRPQGPRASARRALGHPCAALSHVSGTSSGPRKGPEGPIESGSSIEQRLEVPGQSARSAQRRVFTDTMPHRSATAQCGICEARTRPEGGGFRGGGSARKDFVYEPQQRKRSVTNNTELYNGPPLKAPAPPHAQTDFEPTCYREARHLQGGAPPEAAPLGSGTRSVV
jgi:hypothetical protein